MPIYEYECDDCGKRCEVIQKFNDEPLSICPECGGNLHKLVSQSSFILKGNGWYVTDYKRAERKYKEGLEKKDNKQDQKVETTTAKK
jgi:putative FmdB family regulatory protein